jgi:glycosyltransferase involved in cell wall biosynthesis
VDVPGWVGEIPDAELVRLYRGARCVVYASLYEGFGLPVLEAMASGTPVVASRLGGLPEVVEHGVTGFLVEPGNVDELRARLAELLGDRRLAEQLGRNARERVLETFTWDACAERCLAAYSELVDTGAR